MQNANGKKETPEWVKKGGDSEKFYEWLNREEAACFNIRQCFIIKIPYSANILFLYTQHYFRDYLLLGEGFEFSGFYNKSDENIYDMDYNIRVLIGSPDQRDFTRDKIKEEMKEEVSSLIESWVADDPDNLSIKEPEEVAESETFRNFMEYGLKDSAAKQFLSGKGSEDIRFRPDFSFRSNGFTDSLYLSYVADREDTVHRTAKAWMEDKASQNMMYLQFLMNDQIRKEMGRINSDRGHLLHKLKAIRDAIRKDYKNVSAVVCKDGKSASVKVPVSYFERADTRFSLYRLQACDRRKLQELYQCKRLGDFHLEDIVRVTYGKKTLYEEGHTA